MPVPTGNEVVTDGRVLRGARTRQRIIEALLDLIHDGTPAPTTAQIAEQAGTSVRSVFQHFDDLEALYAGLVAEQAERVAPLLRAPRRDGSVEERIDALVEHRERLYEHISPVRHAIGTRAGCSPVLRVRLDELSSVLRRQVARQFDAEIAEPGTASSPAMLDAIDLVTSFEAWDRLRVAQGLDPRGASATMRAVLVAVLR